MMNITYRKAVEEDNNSINELFIEMIKTINKRMIKDNVKPYTELEKGYEEGYLDTFYVDDKRVIFVADDNNKIVGFISIVMKNDCLYIDDYCVTKNYQRIGIGSNLLALAEKYTIDHNLYDINLHVQASNYESRKFYEKKGYKFIECDEKGVLLGKEIKKEEIEK